jgi:hypothetical protein
MYAAAAGVRELVGRIGRSPQSAGQLWCQCQCKPDALGCMLMGESFAGAAAHNGRCFHGLACGHGPTAALPAHQPVRLCRPGHDSSPRQIGGEPRYF